MAKESKSDVLWAQLSKDTSSVIVEHTKEWGRYFVAARDFKEDEPVHVEDAYAATIYLPVSKNTCDYCYSFTPKENMQHLCNKCKLVSYCSRKCKTDAQYHPGLECEIFQKLDMSKIDDDANIVCAVALSIRILALRTLELTTKPELTYDHFSQLIMHKKNEYPKEMEDKFDEVTDYLMSLGSNGTFMGVGREELLNTILRYYSNSFGLWDEPEWTEDSECVGIAIFLKACFFNHSCSPNVKAIRKDRTFTFVTTEDVKAGDALCISYVDPSLPKKKRQEELMNEFAFLCACTTCTEEDEEEEEEEEEPVKPKKTKSAKKKRKTKAKRKVKG